MGEMETSCGNGLIHEIVQQHLKVDCDILKMYTKATTKIIKQRVIATKTTKMKKWNKNIQFNPKEGRRRGKDD